MRTLIMQNPICAILRHIELQQTISYAKAIYDGGVRLFEVAANSENAYRQIAMLREYFGDKAFVGAGTVITKERCCRSREAGAQFFLTPSASVGTMEYCREHDIPLLPGVMTPTDVGVCLSYGYSTMKLFPAGDLPPGYIKSLKGPYDGTEYVAVGGVTPENIGRFLDAGFIGVGIGSNLAPREAVEDKKWDVVAESVRRMCESIKGE